MADLIGRCMNRMHDEPDVPGRKFVSACCAPAEAERAALIERQRELLDSLRPAEPRDLVPILVKLIANGDAFGMSREEAIEKAKLYAEAAQGLPWWAVDRARVAFSRPGWKSSWNGKGIPSSAEVVSECRTILTPIDAELYRLTTILTAEIVDTASSPEERAKAVAAWEKARGEILRSSKIPGRTDEEVDRERSEQSRANALVRDREERAKRRLQAEIDASLKDGGEPFTGIERSA